MDNILEEFGIVPLKNYLIEEERVIQIKTVNVKTFKFVSLDYDGESWLMGKTPLNTYRRIKKDSVKSVAFLPFRLNPNLRKELEEKNNRGEK